MRAAAPDFNDIISKAFRVNWIKVKLIRQCQTRLEEALILPVMTDHMAIIEAVAARDAERATEAMAIHIGNARNRALEI